MRRGDMAAKTAWMDMEGDVSMEWRAGSPIGAMCW